jgi:hypothetical protein
MQTRWDEVTVTKLTEVHMHDASNYAREVFEDVKGYKISTSVRPGWLDITARRHGTLSTYGVSAAIENDAYIPVRRLKAVVRLLRDTICGDPSAVMNSLELAFGLATFGEPAAYADMERTNPYRSFSYASKDQYAAIDALIGAVAKRSKGGKLILRTGPMISRMDDGRYHVRATLTFENGLIGTETDEGRTPHIVGGLKGDGVTDDAEALRRAMGD